ncbi:MAG: hypothetical protein EOP48_16940 [Sphingobacteriales bacterium]|nr:MAG: hypothetical protein EOP48_16940 [Sphingobacteriales bacterium]
MSPFSGRGDTPGRNFGANASAEIGTNQSVRLNPGYNNELSPEDVITHEVGIHNMALVHHRENADGSFVYPPSNVKSLESNTANMVVPTESETQIINNGLMQNRLDTVQQP